MQNFKGLLAIDPGATIGYSVFNGDAVFMDYGEISHRDLPDTLLDLHAKHGFSHIVVEDFKLFGHKAKQQIGSHFEASQGIGQCELFAKMKGLEFAKQPSNILPIASMWSQKPVPKHGVQAHDWLSAYNHGFYWLVKNGLRETILKESLNAAKEEG